MLNKRMSMKRLVSDYETIKHHRGCVSIFWITETTARAKRIMFLEDAGALFPDKLDDKYKFPTVVFVMNDSRFSEIVR